MEGLDRGRRLAREDFGVEMRWVFDVIRNTPFHGDGYNPEPANVTLEHALLGREVGVVGLGLGGAEVGSPPEPFAHAFWQAKEAGLLSVPHAGETVGPASVWGALHALHADRIGHGVRAIEDPALLHYLREHQVPLEVCPTSNVRLGVYPNHDQHPFPHLDRMGLCVTVNSDDPPLFNADLLHEYTVLAERFGYGPADLVRIARNAFLASAAEPALKERLLAELDDFATKNSS
ncbi:MAG: adenosine deaminase family protein [Caldilineae bacterium]|nr:MAG: adenosine deaminase family protein [Caldilineae bacterium]